MLIYNKTASGDRGPVLEERSEHLRPAAEDAWVLQIEI